MKAQQNSSTEAKKGVMHCEGEKSGGSDAVIIEPSNPITGQTQHLPLDEAYSHVPFEAIAKVFPYEQHIRRIGEAVLYTESGDEEHKRHRWVVERTIGWLNHCRGF